MKYLFYLALIIAVVIFVQYLVKDSRASRRKPPTRTGPARRAPSQRSRRPPATPSKAVPSRAASWLHSPEEVFTKEYVSFTRLKVFDQCPRRFELVYLMGKADPVGKPAEVGSVVHKLLELYTGPHSGPTPKGLRIEADSAEAILENFDSAIQSVRPRNAIAKRELLPYCRAFVDLNESEWPADLNRNRWPIRAGIRRRHGTPRV